jgi:lipoate synthase
MIYAMECEEGANMYSSNASSHQADLELANASRTKDQCRRPLRHRINLHTVRHYSRCLDRKQGWQEQTAKHVVAGSLGSRRVLYWCAFFLLFPAPN